MQHLNRRFSPLNMLLISINGMVGSAWLFAPLYAAKMAGPYALIAWLLGGAITILIALTFAEASTLVPMAGGTTQLSQLSHGTTTGFIISWIAWLSCVTMPPIEVQATLQYASVYFPSLTHVVNGTPVLSGVGLCFATILMLALSILNIVSFRGLVGFNLILFAFKIFVIFLTITMLIGTQFNTVNFTGMNNLHGLNTWQTIFSAVASAGIAFAFTGFKHGVELAGEAKNAQVAIPLAIIGSVACCLLLYLGLQVAFIGALTPDAIKNGWHTLTYQGDVGPFVGIAALLGLVILVKLLYIDAAVSPLGAGLIYATSTARIIYAMSKNGYLPTFLTRLNKQHFPIWAILLNFVVGMFLFLPLPGWQNMVSFLVSAVVISYAMGPISVMALRKQLPNERRSFRLPAVHLFSFLAFYCCNLMSYWTGWDTMWKLAIAIVVGLIIFAFSLFRGRLQQTNLGLRALVWIIPYLSGLIIISYLGSFGGKQLITFGWDFLIIAIFSAIILYLSVLVRSKQTAQLFEKYKTNGFEADEQVELREVTQPQQSV